MTLSIIIVNYNVKYFLEQCLCSVKDAICNIDAEVIVIDNDSSDESIAYLQPAFSWVKFIQNERNEGFSKANNKALQAASGSYILFLNPDTILAEDTLEQCLSFYQKNNTNTGAIGVRMLDGSGNFLPESKRSFPSPLVSLYKLTGLSALFPSSKRFGKYALGYLPKKEVHQADVISGAFMMVPKKILDETGGFDEQFFMYGEDIDLSYRIQKSGYKNFYLGHVAIVHFKGESTKKGSLRQVIVFYNAMSLFVRKWYRGSGAWLLRQSLQAGIIARGSASAVYSVIVLKTKSPQVVYKEAALVGNPEQTRLAAQIIECYYPNIRMVVIADKTNKIQVSENSLLVFCMGDLSYKNSIELIQINKASSFKWFGKESFSIVGSDDKNNSVDALIRS